MNRSKFLIAGLAILGLTGSCAQQGLGDTNGSGGRRAGTGGQTSGSGGSGSGSGGDTGSGSGGTTGGSGGEDGTVGSGGSIGSGGGPGSGGSTGSGGGSEGGSGGGVGSGGSTGSGGRVGTGGAPGTGGRGGTAGGGSGGAGGSGTIDIATVAPGLDGYYWEGSCVGNVSVDGTNCPFYSSGVTSCPNQNMPWAVRGTIVSKTLKLRGTPGQPYTIKFEVRGVLGGRCYKGGTAPAGSLAAGATPNPDAPNNTFYIGGEQYDDSYWNTYEIHLDKVPAGKPTVYYLNATGTNVYNDKTTRCGLEGTYEVGYMAEISAMGDATITFTIHDSNCKAQQNCGAPLNQSTCTGQRVVKLADLSPPGTFAQPPVNVVGTKTYRPQWAYLDVKAITSP